jgi:hypothetical protein
MLEDMQPEVDINIEDEPMLEVKEFLRLLKALKESLHEHTKVTLHAFLSRLMAMQGRIWALGHLGRGLDRGPNIHLYLGFFSPKKS